MRIKIVETKGWQVPERLIGETIAIHVGKQTLRRPGNAIELDFSARVGDDWPNIVPAGAVVANATIAGMARIAGVYAGGGFAVNDARTECAVEMGSRPTSSSPWGDHSPGRWL